MKAIKSAIAGQKIKIPYESCGHAYNWEGQFNWCDAIVDKVLIHKKTGATILKATHINPRTNIAETKNWYMSVCRA